jgi:hypothetical protein
MATDKFGQPYGSSWEGMSMGEGAIKIKGWPNTCPTSPDPEKRHVVTVLSNVQSVEHFKCNYCGEEWSD